ncbi:DUF5320 domain-containing protein [Candidatus Pacearchaeota archaeon]|nr:DUF5320 domain-containing protein [Candidatus Pacearchaeota archaeon]
MNCYSMQCSGVRQFLTKDEKLEMLREYKEALDNETKGVSERIKELENED